MASEIDLFCEDRGHEQFARALIGRLAQEARVPITLQVRSARGGHGRALGEFRAWQAAFVGGLKVGTPELLVLVIDGNCQGWNIARQGLASGIDGAVFPRSVVGCPDPHVERWCLADPLAFKAVVGIDAPRDPDKCERELYKRLLREAMEKAGQPILTDVMEFAQDIVEQADLYAAGAAQPSLGSFIGDLRGAIKLLGEVSSRGG